MNVNVNGMLDRIGLDVCLVCVCVSVEYEEMNVGIGPMSFRLLCVISTLCYTDESKGRESKCKRNERKREQCADARMDSKNSRRGREKMSRRRKEKREGRKE